MKNCTQVLKSVVCLFVLFLSLKNASKAQQIEKNITASNGDQIGFLEYKPADYDKNTNKYPVIIFLHGIGERGNGTTDLKNVNCCGIPRIITMGHKMTFTWNGKTETFLVLSPQCPKKYYMWPAAVVQSVIDYAKQNLRVDENRIYMTGLSMGGGGTFRYISTSATAPTNLAATATICSPCTFSNGSYVANAKLPVWAFHAANDSVALASCTEAAVKGINNANPAVKPLKTIWPTGGHIVWDRVYTDTSYKYDGVLNIYEWFLGQNKSLPVNKWPVANAGATINTTTDKSIVTLNGSASTDADGKIVRYVWKKIAGPNAGKITTAFGTNSSTTVTGLTIAGTYKYELAVVDDRAGFTKDTLTVNVGAVGTIPTQPKPVDTTSAPVAKDPVTTPPVVKDTVVTTPPVIKDTVKTPVDTVKAPPVVKDTVTAPTTSTVNQAPIAYAGDDQIVKLTNGDSAILNATSSKDTDGSVKSFYWSKVSGPTCALANAYVGKTLAIKLKAGVYIFRVFVTDNTGAVSADDVVVTVLPKPNMLPVARAGEDRTHNLSTQLGRELLNGSLSTDADGWITKFAWTKISGPNVTITEKNRTQVYADKLEAGTYVFRLTVTDTKGDTAYDDVTLKVVKTTQSLSSSATIQEEVATPAQPIVAAKENISVYPNPAVNSFVLKYESKLTGKSVASIYNANGNLVKSINFIKGEGTYQQSIPVTDLEKGMYHVVVRNGNKQQLNIKLIKK